MTLDLTAELGAINARLPYELAFTQEADLAFDRTYYGERADEIAVFAANHREMLASYIGFCDERGFLPDEAAYTVSEHVCEQLEQGVAEMRRRLKAEAPQGQDYYKHITELERIYRSLTLLKVPAVRVMSWSSSAYGQSLETFHFQPEQYGGMGDRFNYDRTESPDVRRWRAQTKEVLGIGERHGLVCLSSGMAGFTLLFQYLVQRALKPGFTMLLPRLVYGETDLLMTEDSQLYKIIATETHDEVEIVASIVRDKPDVVLLEGMRNGQGNPLVDMPELVRLLNAEVLEKDVYLIVDDTLLTGAYVLADMVSNPRVKVFQYISAMKYLQLGMDAGLAGAVIVPKDDEYSFRKMASYLGLVLYDSVALTYPTFDRAAFLRRQERLTRNAYVVAKTLRKRFGATGLQVMYPLLEEHPHFEKAVKLPFVGTLVSLDVSAIVGQQVSEKNLKPLMVLLEKFLVQAQRQGLSIAATESFGLGTPRVTVNWCKRTKPYIRIAAGDRSLEETVAIANLIADELLRQLG